MDHLAHDRRKRLEHFLPFCLHLLIGVSHHELVISQFLLIVRFLGPKCVFLQDLPLLFELILEFLQFLFLRLNRGLVFLDHFRQLAGRNLARIGIDQCRLEMHKGDLFRRHHRDGGQRQRQGHRRAHHPKTISFHNSPFLNFRIHHEDRVFAAPAVIPDARSGSSLC